MGCPPQRCQDEEQVPTRGGDPAAGPIPHEQDKGWHDPHPVMRPGDRRDQQAGRAGHYRRAQPVGVPGQHGGHHQPEDPDRQRQQGIPGTDVGDPSGDPGGRTQGGLVADVGGADALGVVEEVPPIEPGGARSDEIPDKSAQDKGSGCGQSGPGSPGEQKQDHEDGRSQLDCSRDAHADPRGTTARDAPDVGEHQSEKKQVDLAQVQRVVHGFQRQAQGHNGGDGGSRCPVTGQLQGDHARPRERRDRCQLPRDPGDGDRYRGEGGKQDGGERRVGEPMTRDLDEVQTRVPWYGVPTPHVDPEVKRAARGRVPGNNADFDGQRTTYGGRSPSPHDAAPPSEPPA